MSVIGSDALDPAEHLSRGGRRSTSASGSRTARAARRGRARRRGPAKRVAEHVRRRPAGLEDRDEVVDEEAVVVLRRGAGRDSPGRRRAIRNCPARSYDSTRYPAAASSGNRRMKSSFEPVDSRAPARPAARPASPSEKRASASAGRGEDVAARCPPERRASRGRGSPDPARGPRRSWSWRGRDYRVGAPCPCTPSRARRIGWRTPS